MTSVVLPAGLALIMVSLGLGLRVADFTRIVRRPRGILLGLANLVVLSPVLAFAIATLYGLDPLFAVGLVLLGASPGGTMANLLTHLARGDTALSVSMTALSSLLAVITVPLYLTLAVSVFDAPVGSDVSVLGVVLPVFAITIVPLASGMLIHARAPTWTARHRALVGRIALGCFVLIVIGAVVTELDAVRVHADELILATLTLNLLAMAISYGLSRLARLTRPQATAVALELGVHNSALAIAIGSLLIDELTIPAAVYSVCMLITGGLFARFMARRNQAVAADGAGRVAAVTGQRDTRAAPSSIRAE